jgi:hypothetical protein
LEINFLRIKYKMNAGNNGSVKYEMFGGNAIAAMEKRMANRAKCSNVNVRGVKPSNANIKACVDRMKAAASGGRRTRRRGGSRKSRRSTTRRSWF